MRMQTFDTSPILKIYGLMGGFTFLLDDDQYCGLSTGKIIMAEKNTG